MADPPGAPDAARLPAGTVTLLFTDVEGSTRLLERQPAAYRAAVRRHHNLPIQATPFIGREHAVAAVTERLRRPDVRLLVLTGPGGVGKTRLALQAAAALLDHFAGGAFFVSLAPLSDPALVPSAITQALGVREAEGRLPLDALREHLRDKHLLLVLDNFEHLVAAAPAVAALLAAALRVKALVTSRAVLRLYGEHDLSVPPLALPDRRAGPTASHLARYEAVHLFVARAQAGRPDFALTDAEEGAALLQASDEGPRLGRTPRSLKHPRLLSGVFRTLGIVAQDQCDYTAARAWLLEALTLDQYTGDRRCEALTQAALGAVATAEGDYPSARAALAKSMAIQQELRDAAGTAFVLERFAALAAAQAQPQRSARLLGAAAALREATGVPLTPDACARLDRLLEPARRIPVSAPCGAAATWASGEQAGRMLALEEAIVYALDAAADATTAAAKPVETPLTPREREVVVLIAQGQTNREIAEVLVITEGTAANHVLHILNRLGLRNRQQITAWAVTRGLLTPQTQ